MDAGFDTNMVIWIENCVVFNFYICLPYQARRRELVNKLRKLTVGIEFAEYVLRDHSFRKSVMICRNYSLILAVFMFVMGTGLSYREQALQSR